MAGFSFDIEEDDAAGWAHVIPQENLRAPVRSKILWTIKAEREATLFSVSPTSPALHASTPEGVTLPALHASTPVEIEGVQEGDTQYTQDKRDMQDSQSKSLVANTGRFPWSTMEVVGGVPNLTQAVLYDALQEGRNNILLKSATGSGKSHLITRLAERIGASAEHSSFRIILVHPHTTALDKLFQRLSIEFRVKKTATLWGNQTWIPTECALILVTPETLAKQLNAALRAADHIVLVIDEFDDVCELSLAYRAPFYPTLGAFVSNMRAKKGAFQVVFMSATCSTYTQNAMLSQPQVRGLELVLLDPGQQGYQGRPEMTRHFKTVQVAESDTVTAARAKAIIEAVKAHDKTTRTIVAVRQMHRKDGELAPLVAMLQKGLPGESKIIHAQLSHGEREGILLAFAKGEPRILISTSVLSRAPDLRVDHVVIGEPASTTADDLQWEGRSGRREIAALDKAPGGHVTRIVHTTDYVQYYKRFVTEKNTLAPVQLQEMQALQTMYQRGDQCLISGMYYANPKHFFELRGQLMAITTTAQGYRGRALSERAV